MTLAHDKIKERLELAGGVCVAATGAVLPLSTALLSLFTGLAFVFWLLSGRFRSLPQLVRTNPVARAALLLLAALIVGLAYSSDIREGLDWLKKYRELLLIVVFMSFLTEERVKRWAVNSFCVGMGGALLFSYGVSLGLLPPSRWGASVESPITHSVLTAFFAFLAGQRALRPGPFRWLWIFAVLTALYNVLFVITGRTGQVIAIALILLFVWQHCDWRRRLIGLTVLVVFFGVALSVSEKFSGLIIDTRADIKAYAQGETFTDVGLRLEWYVNSLELIKEKPLAGYGTGGFVKAYAELAREKGIVATDNPHNEYLAIGVQLGLVGLGLFIFLFITQLRATAGLEVETGRLAQALVLTMALGCLANSFLLDCHEGHFYAFFSAVFFAPLSNAYRTGNRSAGATGRS